MKAPIIHVALAMFAALAAMAGEDRVSCLFHEKARRDGKASLCFEAELSNAQNSYRLSFSNLRAYAKDPQRFEMLVDNGQQSGFTKLTSVFSLSVNGIDARKLQPGRDAFRTWDGEHGERGVVFSLNFDGARVDVRFSMKPGSPVLWGEIAKTADLPQLTPVSNAVVIVTAIPSFLDCASGRKTRFFGYARQVRTSVRLLALPPNRKEPLLPEDRFLIFEDAEYDGSADGKGMGPSATWPLEQVQGTINLNDSWTTSVEYRPDPSRPFRFALLEFRAKRVSNAEFLEAIR